MPPARRVRRMVVFLCGGAVFVGATSSMIIAAQDAVTRESTAVPADVRCTERPHSGGDGR